MPETLREKASKKLNGPDANPSQLGDPISIKAEQSDNVPNEDAEGAAAPPSSSSPSPSSAQASSKASNNKNPEDETLREKAAKKLNGSDANPSQLGDPISLKAETSDSDPTEGEEGAKRDSKL